MAQVGTLQGFSTDSEAFMTRLGLCEGEAKGAQNGPGSLAVTCARARSAARRRMLFVKRSVRIGSEAENRGAGQLWRGQGDTKVPTATCEEQACDAPEVYVAYSTDEFHTSRTPTKRASAEAPHSGPHTQH
eukprot:359072-Chlamydomonas_euryale.AAC.7